LLFKSKATLENQDKGLKNKLKIYHQINHLVMDKFNVRTALVLMLVTAISLTGCEVIEGIFKAGVWVGVIIVVVIIALIFWLIRKVGRK
jgi:hypothetical protein